MNLPRRRFLYLAAGAAALPAGSRIVQAQSYPTRPVRIVVGFPPGGPTDIVARIMGQWLSERLGQSFVIENRPGAGGNIATETVVRAFPDGYTLLMVASIDAINATLYANLNFNFIRDIAPGEINMASNGTGSFTHIAGELFKFMAGVDMVHVPYRGEMAAQADLLSGRAQVMFDAMISSIEYIRAGELRALATTTATRTEVLPEIPTVGEFVPGYEATSWLGVGAPRNTPAEIVDKLNKEFNAALADPKMNARLADVGSATLALSPADFGKLIIADTEKWAKVIKFGGIIP